MKVIHTISFCHEHSDHSCHFQRAINPASYLANQDTFVASLALDKHVQDISHLPGYFSILSKYGPVILGILDNLYDMSYYIDESLNNAY